MGGLGFTSKYGIEKFCGHRPLGDDVRGLAGLLLSLSRLSACIEIGNVHGPEDAPLLRADARGGHLGPVSHIDPREGQISAHAFLTALVKLCKPLPEVFRRWRQRQIECRGVHRGSRGLRKFLG